MNRFARQLLLVLIALVAAALTGCATMTPQQTAFLGRDVNFQPAPDGSGAKIYRKPGLTREQILQYTGFIVEPVAIWYSEDSEFKGVFPDEMKAIADYYREAVINALKDRYTVATQPGPNVVIIRAAITEMKRTTPVRLYQFTPVGLALTAVKEASGMDEITREKIMKENSYIMEASMEAGFYDSRTNELLGAYWDHKGGLTSKEPPRGGVTWGQVKSALDDWAKKLRTRLDAAHGAP